MYKKKIKRIRLKRKDGMKRGSERENGKIDRKNSKNVFLLKLKT